MSSETPPPEPEPEVEPKKKTCTLYGASWCGYTRKQQESLKNDGLLDEMAKNNINIKILDCASSTQTCPKLSGYPTWQNAKGDLMPGYTTNKDKLTQFCSA